MASERMTKAQRDAARRAEVDRLRREQQGAARRRRIFGWGGAGLAVLIAAAIVVVIVVTQPKPTASAGPDTPQQIIPAAVSGAATQQQPVNTAVDDSGIPGVLAWDTDGWPGDGNAVPGALEHQHVDGPVEYTITPPVGGPHNPVWMNAGVYTQPIPTERAVHNLEHGAVWITYSPDLPASEVQALVDFVGSQSLIDEPSTSIPGQSNRYVDLSPWADSSLPSPIVISSWGHQLGVTSASDSRLQDFVDTFRYSQKYSPEYGAPVDGVPVQTGGVPAAYGSSQPNPPGSAN